jgi:hypothetical protein
VKPFDEQIEGLSHFADERCAVQREVQTEDLQHLTLRRAVGDKPTLVQALREFKHLLRQLGLLIPSPVNGFQLQRQARDAVTESSADMIDPHRSRSLKQPPAQPVSGR